MLEKKKKEEIVIIESLKKKEEEINQKFQEKKIKEIQDIQKTLDEEKQQ